MRVLICGDRNWNNELRIRQTISLIPSHKDELTIIEGGARGADKIAAKVAQEMGIKFTEIPALWKEHGKRAGPERNSLMLALEPHLVIAFHNNIYASKGTADTIKKANMRRIRVNLVSNTEIRENFIYDNKI